MARRQPHRKTLGRDDNVSFRVYRRRDYRRYAFVAQLADSFIDSRVACSFAFDKHQADDSIFSARRNQHARRRFFPFENSFGIRFPKQKISARSAQHSGVGFRRVERQHGGNAQTAERHRAHDESSG